MPLLLVSMHTCKCTYTCTHTHACTHTHTHTHKKANNTFFNTHTRTYTAVIAVKIDCCHTDLFNLCISPSLPFLAPLPPLPSPPLPFPSPLPSPPFPLSTPESINIASAAWGIVCMRYEIREFAVVSQVGGGGGGRGREGLLDEWG